MNTGLFAQQLLNGLAVGGVYALFALGYTLVFSILRVINFTHGALFALGAYFTYALTGSAFGFNGLFANSALPFSLPFWLAGLVGGALAGVVGMGVERVAFKPLRDRNADPLLTLVSSLGMAVVIVNLIQLLVGAEIYSYPQSVLAGLPPALVFGSGTGTIRIRTVQAIIFVVSMILVVLLTLLINRTRLGKALRAISEDATTSSLLGINTDRHILFTFFLSGFLGGIAGVLIGLSVGIAGPYFGIVFGLKGLAVMVLGGLGSIPGAVVGGFAIGMAEALVPPEYVAYKEVIAFLFLFVMLLIRPQGLLGRPQTQKV